MRDGNAPVPRALVARRRPPAARVGDELVLADRRLPGGAAARRRRRHAGVPLVGEGPRTGDRDQPPEGRGGDRAPPLRRARAAVRRRREPGEHPLRRRAAQHAHDEHGDRPQAAGPAGAGLLRLLRQPVRRRAHGAAGDRRDLPGALRRRAAGAARRAPADQAQLRVRARARLRHRDPARPAGGGRDRGHPRRAAGRLHDVPGLRRGGAPLGRRAAGHAGRAAARRPGDPDDRRRPCRTRRGRTGSSCCPTTGRARARRSCSATARRSRTWCAATAAAPSGPRTRAATRAWRR